MGPVETRQGIIELRTEAFRLAESMSRDAISSGNGSGALDAATTLQSVAFMLGEVERYLADVGTREVEDRLSVA